MKKIIFLFAVLVLSFSAAAQQRLLSARIVYQVPIMKAEIKSSEAKDSIVYTHLVDKRFWWQSIDAVNEQAKNKAIFYQTKDGKTLIYDSILAGLGKELGKICKREFSKEDLQKVIEEEIRAIKFEEQWFYDPSTMLIRKNVLGFCPIVTRDSIVLVEEELKLRQAFSYELGWVRPKGEEVFTDTVVVARNIEFTIPIYNPKPYHWWDSHLEAEYSIPFVEGLIRKAEKGEIKVWDNPSASEELIKPEILKRRQYEILETLVVSAPDGGTIQKDTIVKASFGVENVDHFRFGEEWYFDKVNFNFIKHTNYFAPMVQIIGKEGDFRGLYPFYYIRRR